MTDQRPPTDDGIEGAWARLLTGREVGDWCVDLIEAFSDSDGKTTERTQAVIARLAELTDQRLVHQQLAQAALLICRELKLYIDLENISCPIPASGDEKFKRALLAARAAMQGHTRSPFQPSDEG